MSLEEVNSNAKTSIVSKWSTSSVSALLSQLASAPAHLASASSTSNTSNRSTARVAPQTHSVRASTAKSMSKSESKNKQPSCGSQHPSETLPMPIPGHRTGHDAPLATSQAGPSQSEASASDARNFPPLFFSSSGRVNHIAPQWPRNTRSSSLPRPSEQPAATSSGASDQSSPILPRLPTHTSSIAFVNETTQLENNNKKEFSISPAAQIFAAEQSSVTEPSSNKQKKREARETAFKHLQRLEESRRQEVEALQSWYMQDLTLISSTPSKVNHLTVIPSSFRLNLYPQPMGDRENENHVAVVLDVAYPPISIPAQPPCITAYPLKGLSRAQMNELNAFVLDTRDSIFGISQVAGDGMLLTLFEKVEEWLRVHNVESASLYELSIKKDREVQEAKALELKARQASLKAAEEEKRKHLAVAIMAAQKRKEVAWADEQRRQQAALVSPVLQPQATSQERKPLQSPTIRPMDTQCNNRPACVTNVEFLNRRFDIKNKVQMRAHLQDDHQYRLERVTDQLSLFEQLRTNEHALLAELDEMRHFSSKCSDDESSGDDENNTSDSCEEDMLVKNKIDIHEHQDSYDESQPLPSSLSSFTMPPLPPTSFSRFRNDFEMLQLLGRGGGGAVYKVRHRVDRLLYAIKVIRLRTHDVAMSHRLIRETSALGLLSHNNVCRAFSAWLESEISHNGLMTRDMLDISNDADDWMSFSCTGDSNHLISLPMEFRHVDNNLDNENAVGQHHKCQLDHESAAGENQTAAASKSALFLFIQLEYCSKGTLKTYLETVNSEERDIAVLCRFLRQILEALEYMHKKGVVHRDIKPANVFLDNFLNVKVGDFGLSHLDHSQLASDHLDVQLLNLDEQNSHVGTALYRPDISDSGEKGDLYSCGILACELFCQFNSQSERVHVLSELRRYGKIPDHATFLSTCKDVQQKENLRALVEWMSNRIPSKRPGTANEILKSGLLLPSILEDHLIESTLLQTVNKSSPHFPKLMELLFTPSNDPLVDFTFDLQFAAGSTKTPTLDANFHVIQDKCHQLLVSIFQRHGASLYSTPAIHPQSTQVARKFNNHQVLLMDPSGVLVQLPYNLTLPFARTVAHCGIQCISDTDQNENVDASKLVETVDLRRYDIAKVYRRQPGDGSPRELTEAVFNLIFDEETSRQKVSATDIAATYGKEKRAASCAECIAVALESFSSFSSSIGPVVVRFTHLRLLDAVVTCMARSIDQSTQAEEFTLRRVIAMVSKSPTTSWSRSMAKRELRSKYTAKAVEWFGACLMLRCSYIDWSQAAKRIVQLLEAAPSSNSSQHSIDVRLHVALAEIESMLTCAKAMGIADRLIFDMSLLSQPDMFADSITFQVFIYSQSKSFSLEPIALGGCYDSVLDSFALPRSRQRLCGFGVAIAVDKIVMTTLVKSEERPTFPSFANLLSVSSLHWPLHSQTKTVIPSVVVPPSLAALFTPSSQDVEWPETSLIFNSAVLLFSPKHQMMRERLTLASLCWASGLTCFYDVPMWATSLTIHLYRVYAWAKVRSVRFVVFLHRRLFRDTSAVEVIDLFNISNSKMWERMVNRLLRHDNTEILEDPCSPQEAAKSQIDMREQNYIATVAASSVTRYIKGRLRPHSIDAAAPLTSTVPSSGSHDPSLTISIIDVSAMKREQRAIVMASAKQALLPFAKLLGNNISFALDVPIAVLRSFTTHFLIIPSHSSVMHTKRKTFKMPQAMSDKLLRTIPVMPPKLRDLLEELYFQIMQAASNSSSECVFYFIFSFPDRKVELLSFNK